MHGGRHRYTGPQTGAGEGADDEAALQRRPQRIRGPPKWLAGETGGMGHSGCEECGGEKSSEWSGGESVSSCASGTQLAKSHGCMLRTVSQVDDGQCESCTQGDQRLPLGMRHQGAGAAQAGSTLSVGPAPGKWREAEGTGTCATGGGVGFGA